MDFDIRISKNRGYWGFLTTTLVLLELITTCNGVEITRLSVPRSLQNGTVESVILDCDYVYTEDDRQLVVKWFLNDDPEPIYQWITELDKRQASWRISGRINMHYSPHPSNERTKYRALNLLRPTTELTGRYTCQVVSLESQDSKEELMIVYAPPQGFLFNYTKESPGTVTLVCEATGVYPRPQITLYKLSIDDGEPEVITDVIDHYEKHKGAYNVRISKKFTDRELYTGNPVMYECALSIPGTEYATQEKLIYYPASDSGQSDCSCKLYSWRLFVVVFILLKTILS